jgi:hypothetical protein
MYCQRSACNQIVADESPDDHWNEMVRHPYEKTLRYIVRALC